jgi:hypothetical protein
MSSLLDILTSEEKKTRAVEDALVVLDQEVDDKGGLSGMGIKAGFAAVKGVNPGFIKQVVTDLLPEFAKALDPIYQEAVSQSRPIAAHFQSNGGRAADALLAITDGKAARSKNGIVKGTYDRLRGTAKKHVESAMPRVGKLIEKYHSA